jgi:hypothetical protein
VVVGFTVHGDRAELCSIDVWVHVGPLSQ